MNHQFLQEVRAQMEVMEDKDKHMVTESTNRKKLLEEVEALVVSFSSLLDTTLFVCLSISLSLIDSQSIGFKRGED